MLELSKILAPGQNATMRKVVQRSDTAANYSETMKEFMSTPSWVDMAIDGDGQGDIEGNQRKSLGF